MKLQQIGDTTWMIPGLVNIGLYVRDGRVILIDSGNDKEAGRQINKLIAGQGWELECIINTHSNADHIGGNAFLRKKTGCRIAATAGEAPFIRRPELEAAFLYGGFPYPGLDNKFLRAEPSELTDIIDSGGPVRLGGPGGVHDTGLEAIPLPGHFFDMIGIRTPDGVVFLGDAVFSEYIITKYHLFFIYDVAAYLSTLDKVAELQADLFVPSHAKPVKDLRELLDSNRNKIEEISRVVAKGCGGFEDILKEVCGHYGIGLDANQYVLVGSTIRSYLSYLAAAGKLTPQWINGTMLWRPPPGT